MRRSLVAALLLLSAPAGADDASLLLATTTSVRDSGLLDALLPTFEERSGVRVRVVAVGTGAALRMGREGNADALLTHAPEAEQALVDAGAVTERVPFMENHFVIAGPESDPAQVKGAATPAEAFRRIAARPAAYVSRGDDSGTHKREKALLALAGVDPGWEGFASTGTGMGLSLQVAGERRAYILSDVGTFLAFRERIALVSLAPPHESLRNVYAYLRVRPEAFPKVNREAAQALERFLVSREAQTRIAEFGRERFGRPLFRPLLLEP